MALKAKIEAIIYAAEEPVTLEQLATLMSEAVLAEEAAEQRRAGADTESVAASGAANAEAASSEGLAASGTSPEPETKSAEGTAAAGDTAGNADAAFSGGVTAQAARRGKSGKDAAKKDPATQARVKARVRALVEELIADYARDERGLEIRQVAGGYRMATKPEHHDVVRAFARSLKPPLRLSIPALETLAVIAYKQPVTVPEISEIRGVEAAGVIGTLLDRKLITTAGRKQVIGRPILYKTRKEFLLRFGLKDLSELPSMEEFEKLAMDGQVELFTPTATTTAQPGAEGESQPRTSADGAAEQAAEGDASTREDTASGS